MKLKFKKQEFQTKAVEAVVDLFKGQYSKASTFSMLGFFNSETVGYGNMLTIEHKRIEENLHEVQMRNMLPLTKLDQLRFNIEMETGTGKTFVYTKTIYELNKLYGFTKFIVLVPSIAIREGVYKSMQTTADYFATEYDGTRIAPFIYNSSRLYEVRDFAQSSNLEIMIINIDAFKKSENLFNQENDKMSKSARDFIKECNPILVVDEPQSIDNTEKSRQAIESLNPLFEIRYSATHKERINTIYKLTPVDAYQMGIVKQICVANNDVVDDFNKPYINLISTDSKKGFVAKLELDVKAKKTGIVSRKIIAVKPNTDLQEVTGRDLYKGYIVSGIDCEPGFELVEFSNTESVSIGQPLGAIDEMLFKREQIKRTIEAHLDKELRYTSKGIKVLSLFFIDEVKKYRDYDSEDQRGIYAKMFEEIYAELIEKPRYRTVKEFYRQSASEVHNGYFAQDKKGKVKDTRGDTTDDISAYENIMKQKEWLLSFDCPLRFIFSHSALKEGWDNPNVFQICTLIDNRTVFTCRQKIGRGLRLCVNQDGDRVEEKEINVLHVIAKESFAEFAEKLQQEIEEETGVKFGILDIGMFVGIPAIDENGEETELTHADSESLLDFFRTKRYIDNKGTMQTTLKNDIQNDTVELPKRFETARERILNQIKQANKKVNVRSARNQVTVKRKDELFHDDRFLALWNRIKQKTIYRINMDIEELHRRCIKEIAEMPTIRKAQIQKSTANISIQKSGVTYKEQGIRYEEFDQSVLIPDVLRILSENTKMPRSNIAEIIIKSERLADFLNNPQKYIEEVTKIIEFNKNSLSIDGIKYTKVEGQEYSYTEVFSLDDTKEVIAFLDSNAVAVANSLYDYVIYDSTTVEKPFAEALDADPDVKLFFKIPDKFKISTPVGNYNPDWAVYVENEDEKKLYFVIETKGSTDRAELRNKEDIKIYCGKKHFEGIDMGIEFAKAKTWAECKKNNI
jgi:type III restriction enzyme